IEAEKNSQVAKIINEQRVMEKESAKTISHIEDDMMFNREKMAADAEYYTKAKMAQANELLLTHQYLELQLYEAIYASSDADIGTNIPSMVYSDNSGQSQTQPGDYHGKPLNESERKQRLADIEAKLAASSIAGSKSKP